jgi:serine phosphatase RsbU (regulator of sigma subunit)
MRPERAFRAGPVPLEARDTGHSSVVRYNPLFTVAGKGPRMPLPCLQLALAAEPLTVADHLRDTPILIFGVLLFCIAATLLALWRSAPDYRVFLSGGLYLGVISFEQFWRYFAGTESEWIIGIWGSIFLVITAAQALQIKNRRWTWLVWPIFVIDVLAVIEMNFDRQRALFLAIASLVVAQVAIAILVVAGFRSRESSLRLIAAGFTLLLFCRCTVSPQFRAMTGIPEFLQIRGWRWYLPTASIVLIGIVTLAVYVRALIQDRREKLRLAGEFEAARAVQQVLIPDQIPAVAGFQIESVYKPAGEVGGDFFQILPTTNGGVLVVIGDVSGKGMPAAMTVSLLVGTVRTLAHYSQSPGEILAAMNQRMLGRSNGGFTTCLLLRVDFDGTITAANAGHLAPYIDGRELALENGLPLGLAASSVYVEATVALSKGGRITLLTDGVVEAQNHRGELFGFDRTRDLSTRSADQIAQAAQHFGQQDDITVLTVVRVPVMAEAAV